ncbi:MAG: carbamate kinase [Halobacteriaceae archaeon]
MNVTVVALGGNALVENNDVTIHEQRKNIRSTVQTIASIHDRSDGLLITHGNGPQVGELLLQTQQTESETPLDVLVAESQAQIGYLLQQELANVLESSPSTVITQTLVEASDPAFDNPTKPIGPYYTENEAKKKDFPVKEVTMGQNTTAYQRVVPSPDPIEIIESDQISHLVDIGVPTVCVGGGGIPVIKENEEFQGVEAVVDKDRATALMAGHISADQLLILTDVDAAYRNFGTEQQEKIASMTPKEAKNLLKAGEFGEGTMAPKIEASINYVRETDNRAIITSINKAKQALMGNAGTIITNE